MSRKSKVKKTEFQKKLEYYTSEHMLKHLESEGLNVAGFLSKMNTVTEGLVYRVIGYGSLMHIKDAERTLNDITSFENATVFGYERIFNNGSVQRGSYLNVRESSSEDSMTVALLTISAEDMLGFIFRERMYDPILVTAFPYGSTDEEGVQASMVMATNPQQLKAQVEPMLSYVCLCNDGARDLMTSNQYREYLMSTIVCKSAVNEMSLYNWMRHFNLMEYSATHRHVSR